MSFGISVGDFVLLVQLAHKAFRNCQQAGDEYLEIASEVRCLHSVLRLLRAEAQRPESKIFRQDPAATAQLIETADGCRNVLASLDAVLAKYDGLKLDGTAGVSKRLIHRIGFGSKIAELGVIRGKLITYTSTLSVLIDAMQLQGTERIETKVEGGFADVKLEMKTQFDLLRREIYSIASQKRAEERMGANFSTLSLSTYAGDEKNVWRDFRTELIAKGFRSDSLERHKDVLQSYMMKLDQSGILDREDNSLGPTPWWAKHMYLETVDSIAEQGTVAEIARTRSRVHRNRYSMVPAVGGDIVTDGNGQDTSMSHLSPRTKSISTIPTIQVEDTQGTAPKSSMEGKQSQVLSLPDEEAVAAKPEAEYGPPKAVPVTNHLPKRLRFTTPISTQWMQSTRTLDVVVDDVAAGVSEDLTHVSEAHNGIDARPPQPSVNDEDEKSVYGMDLNGELGKIQDHLATLSLSHEAAPLDKLPRGFPTMSTNPSDSPSDGEFANVVYVETSLPVVNSTSHASLPAETAPTMQGPTTERPPTPASYASNYILAEAVVEQTPIQSSFKPVSLDFFIWLNGPVPPLMAPAVKLHAELVKKALESKREPIHTQYKEILNGQGKPSRASPKIHREIQQASGVQIDPKTGNPWWTKVPRWLVNPEALRSGNERFKVIDDHVCILRMLTKAEVQHYADVTAMVRQRRRADAAEGALANESQAAVLGEHFEHKAAQPLCVV